MLRACPQFLAVLSGCGVKKLIFDRRRRGGGRTITLKPAEDFPIKSRGNSGLGFRRGIKTDTNMYVSKYVGEKNSKKVFPGYIKYFFGTAKL